MTQRACDLCQQSLPAEVVEFEVLRGRVVALPRRQWGIQPRPGGRQLRIICHECSDFLTAALAHLSKQLRAEGGWRSARAVEARKRATRAA